MPPGTQPKRVGPALLRLTVQVGMLFVAYAFLPLRGEGWWIGALLGAALLAAIIPVTIHRLKKVQASSRPFLDAGEALAVLITMLVVGFAAVYFAMGREGQQFSGLDTRIDGIYFTVTTLSTVGYGDIAATDQAARLVVSAQILLDLLYLGLAAKVLTGAADFRFGEENR